MTGCYNATSQPASVSIFFNFEEKCLHSASLWLLSLLKLTAVFSLRRERKILFWGYACSVRGNEYEVLKQGPTCSPPPPPPHPQPQQNVSMNVHHIFMMDCNWTANATASLVCNSDPQCMQSVTSLKQPQLSHRQTIEHVVSMLSREHVSYSSLVFACEYDFIFKLTPFTSIPQIN